MKDYKRLTTYNEKYKCYAIDNNKLQKGDDVCYMDTNEDIFVGGAIDKFADLEDKIENGTLVEIKTIAKIMNNTFGCPCEYGLDVYAFSQYDDWCEKSCGGVCDADDYTACWETYLTTKLRELKEKGNENIS